jgi:hypothetical protein
MLEIDSVKLGPTVAAGTTLDFTIPAPGTINVSVSNQTADLSPGSGQFALVSLIRADSGTPGQFLSPLVPADAPYGGTHVLDIDNLQIWGSGDAPIAAVANDGVHIAAYAGELSGNQAYNSPDASFAQQFIVNQASFGLAAYPLVDPIILADINANGSVQGNDVAQIQRLILNLSNPFVPPRSTGPSAPTGDMAFAATSGSDPSRKVFAGDALNGGGGNDLMNDTESPVDNSFALQALWASLGGKQDETFGGLALDFFATDDASVDADDEASADWLLGFLAPDRS